jgi:hypothetical protein
MKDSFFKKLTVSEEKQFRQWARDNWKFDDDVPKIWHPIVKDEIKKIKEEVVKTPGQCPRCKSNNLEFDDTPNDDGETISYYYECLDCGFKGEEVYFLQFAHHYAQ